MKKSYYFSELSSSYDAEIQDLLSDSEGKSALKARLSEKRRELKSILPMVEFSPEMVVPVFYDAFTFTNPKGMSAAVMCEPDDGDFPTWDQMSSLIQVTAWAQDYVDTTLADPAGESFLVTAACLEFIRLFDAAPPIQNDEKDDENEKEAEKEAKNYRNNGENSDDDGDQDLSEAGGDWLEQQGFDSLKS